LGFSASGGPTYLPAIFVLSAKPNKMAEDRTIPYFSINVNKFSFSPAKLYQRVGSDGQSFFKILPCNTGNRIGIK
jgi:hypothetical protein